MSCDSPMIRFFNPRVLSENGKPVTVKMLGLHTALSDDEIDGYYKKLSAKFEGSDDMTIYYGDGLGAQLVPCGKCTGCRLEYSRQWAIRCVLESLQYEHNYFLTLTYDDSGSRFDWKSGFYEKFFSDVDFLYKEPPESFKKYLIDDNGLKIPNLPRRPFYIGCDPETGEVLFEGHPCSLIPDDLSKFMKDLREFFRVRFGHTGIRFFACGEYGGKTARPHFHVLLFNCPIPDLHIYKRNFQNQPLFNSKTVDLIWKKGYSVIAEVNFTTCAYVARYIMKKQKGENSKIYDILGVLPEFTRCSRNPGIGRFYYDEYRDKIYTFDQVTLVGSDGTIIQPCPPKYFDCLYDHFDGLHMQDIKDKRLLKIAASERTRLFDTRLSKSTHIKLQADARDRLLISLQRVN